MEIWEKMWVGVSFSEHSVLMTNRKSNMHFRLTPRLMTLDDLALLYGEILSEFRVISRFWEATEARRMKIDP